MPETTTKRIERLMKTKSIKDMLTENARSKKQIENAIEYLITEHQATQPGDEEILWTVERLREPLLTGNVTAFCSYKTKDKPVALKLEALFSKWSGHKLRMIHMAQFPSGKEWRKKIKEIPSADWFLLLMPEPEADRDWPLFEAGYFRPGGRTLSRRLVCLHHPDNEVTDTLVDHQSVPAETEMVEKFLKELLVEPNWIPGLPAISPGH